MMSRFASHRAAWMLPYLQEKRAPAVRRRPDDAPSPTVLVAKVLAGALLVFAGLTFVALAPATVAVLVALAAISGLLAWIGRARYAEPRTRGGKRRRWSRGTAGWGTLALSSVALLVLALVLPAGYDIVFAGLGLAGMVAVRLGMRPMEGQVPERTRVSASDRPIPRRWRRGSALEQYGPAAG
jgi:hypothetical protein